MKAIAFSEFGGPEVLRMIEKLDPEPGRGEVVVAVTASTVNPTDLMNLSGMRAHLMRDLSLFGKNRRADLLNAPLINGIAGASYAYFDSYSAAHLHAGVVHTGPSPGTWCTRSSCDSPW